MKKLLPPLLPPILPLLISLNAEAQSNCMTPVYYQDIPAVTLQSHKCGYKSQLNKMPIQKMDIPEKDESL